MSNAKRFSPEEVQEAAREMARPSASPDGHYTEQAT